MRRAAGFALLPLPLLALPLLAGCEDQQHGFLKIGGSVLFGDADQLACGEAKVAPRSGIIDAFLTLKPQDCALTLHRAGDFLGFGTRLCMLHIANNRITSVYLTEGRAGVACSVGGA